MGVHRHFSSIAVSGPMEYLLKVSTLVYRLVVGVEQPPFVLAFECYWSDVPVAHNYLSTLSQRMRISGRARAIQPEVVYTMVCEQVSHAL